MKKGFVISILFLVVLVLIVFFVVEIGGGDDIKKWENSELLELDSQIGYLELCRESIDLGLNSDSAPAEARYCVSDGKETIPSEEEILKFKLLDGKRIIEICEYGILNCNLESEVEGNCEELWEISYETLSARPHGNIYSIHQCGDDYYLYFESNKNGPLSNKIDMIELDDSLISLF